MSSVYKSSKWQRVKRLAYERDSKAGAKCWICGGDIDYLAPPQTPDAYEADHYLPTSEHPELAYEITNLRPSHCSCNRSRGSKSADVSDAALGTPSADWCSVL